MRSNNEKIKRVYLLGYSIVGVTEGNCVILFAMGNHGKGDGTCSTYRGLDASEKNEHAVWVSG